MTDDIPWPVRREMIHDQFPSTTVDTGSLIVNDEHALSGLLRTILHVGQTPAGQSGRRRPLDVAKAEEEYTEFRDRVRDDNYSNLPFHEAFRVLARDRATGRDHSRTEIARKTGLSRSRVHRLLTRAESPKPADLEVIARAYRKPASYFGEYRSQFVARHLATRLEENPEMSQAVYRKIVG